MLRGYRRRVALAALLAMAAGSAAASPELDYMLQCQGCHLGDGTGKPPEVPSLAGFVGRFLGVPGGREYLVQVPGSAQSPLSDAELAGVLNWMIRRYGPERIAADFAPYTAAEVAGQRGSPLVDVATRRRSLIAAIEREREP